MLDKMIAYCGLDCTQCLAYLATQQDDDEEREKIAEEWNSQYDYHLKPQDVNCDGCLQNDGRLLNYCLTCEVRECGIQKGVKNCAYCVEYACDKLKELEWYGSNSYNVTATKPTLDEIRESL